MILKCFTKKSQESEKLYDTNKPLGWETGVYTEPDGHNSPYFDFENPNTMIVICRSLKYLFPDKNNSGGKQHMGEFYSSIHHAIEKQYPDQAQSISQDIIDIRRELDAHAPAFGNEEENPTYAYGDNIAFSKCIFENIAVLSAVRKALESEISDFPEYKDYAFLNPSRLLKEDTEAIKLRREKYAGEYLDITLKFIKDAEKLAEKFDIQYDTDLTIHTLAKTVDITPT